MKLRTFDSSIQRKQQVVNPLVTVSPSGGIFFSKGFYQPVGLVAGDKVLFHQDSESRTDWYIEKTTQVNGILVRDYKKNVCIQSTFVAREILKCTGESKTKRFPVSVKPFIFNDRKLYHVNISKNPIDTL